MPRPIKPDPLSLIGPTPCVSTRTIPPPHREFSTRSRAADLPSLCFLRWNMKILPIAPDSARMDPAWPLLHVEINPRRGFVTPKPADSCMRGLLVCRARWFDLLPMENASGPPQDFWDMAAGS